MELKQKASCSMTKHNIKVERIQGALGIARCPVLANENVSINLSILATHLHLLGYKAA